LTYITIDDTIIVTYGRKPPSPKEQK